MNGSIDQKELEDFLYQECYRIMAEEMTKEIDNQIIWEIVKENGMHHIKLHNKFSIDEIKTWLKENCKEHYLLNLNTREFLFASDKDQVLFKLRWA